MPRPLLRLALLLACAAPAFAQAPYLVRDLGNGSPAVQSSEPGAFLSSGGKLFFTAKTETNGIEPWVSDSNGTRLLRDINSGTATSGVTRFVELTPGVVVFSATDGVTGTQLWRSDATEAGTTIIKAVNASTTTAPFPSYASAGKVFFFVDDGTHGREPWVTDGTADGTKLLFDTRPGTASTSNVQFFQLGGSTRFFASGGIWTTDGTPEGTSLTVALAGYRLPCAVNGTHVYFFNYDANSGYELWKSDLSTTVMVRDIREGTGSSVSSVSMAATANGVVFFADDGSGGRLWTSDGTTANTVPLGEFPASAQAYLTFALYPTPTKGVFFNAGPNVWRTDGTQAGTYISASMSDSSFGFIEAFSNVYFTSWVDGERRLFSMDGSEGTTPTGVIANVVNNVTLTGGKLWFSGTDATTGSELWVSDDGTRAGTHIVANIAPDPARSSTPESLTAMGSQVYFSAQWPEDIYRSDGTSAGTVKVTNFANISTPFAYLTPLNGTMYFRAGYDDVYRIDPVNGGESLVGSYGFADQMTADANALYLWQSSRAGILRVDGAGAAAVQIYDAAEEHLRNTYDSVTVVPYAGVTWIACYHGLFRTGGTVDTTKRLVSLNESGTYLQWPLVGSGGLLYAVINSYANGSELWRSDGSAAGSFRVRDIYPGSTSSYPRSLTAAGRLLYFVATDPDHGAELWRTDGTEAGTFMVRDIRPGTASSSPSSLAVMDGIVYFAAFEPNGGIELWKSDGTEQGTVLVRDIAPGVYSSRPAGLSAAGGKIWFSANDGLHGIELWSSDGTEAGTVMVSDIIPGSSSSAPEQFTPAEQNLFFTATTDAEGRELWVVSLDTSSLSVGDVRMVEGNAGTRTMRFTVTRHGATGGTAGAAYATADGTATAGADYEATSGTLSFAAGETTKSVDVTIYSDTTNEPDERLFLQLSTPTGAALEAAIGSGTIEDDEPLADLRVLLMQNNSGTSEASRTLYVDNAGPSSATNVRVTFTESPFSLWISGTNAVSCTNTLPSQCTVPFLPAGGSVTINISRDPVEGAVDPAAPPGRTMNASIASDVPDPDLTNNTASAMTTGDGALFLPAKLVVGKSASANFRLASNATSPTDVTLTSSSSAVIVTPATATIPAGQMTTTFILTPVADAPSTLLTATIASDIRAQLVAPIVTSGEPLRDIAIVARNAASLAWGAAFTIPVRVAARTADGTLPTGVVTLLDENGTTLDQLTIDNTASATFTRPTLAPGQYRYKVRYEGDSRFNAMTVALAATTVQKANPRIVIHAPLVSCSNPVQVRITVIAPAGAPAPTGTVRVSKWNADYGTHPLATTAEPLESEASTSITFSYSYQSFSVEYSGDSYFAATTLSRDISIGCTPMNFVATATSPTSVALSWTAQPQAIRYFVSRADSIDGPYTSVTNTTGLTATDNGVQPNRVYVYVVNGYGASYNVSYTSGHEIASTMTYSDNPLAPGMWIKSAHLTELRALISALRSAAGLRPLAFTGPVSPGSAVDARHLSELRDSIDASRARIGLPAIAWQQPNAARGAIIRAATVQELREAVK